MDIVALQPPADQDEPRPRLASGPVLCVCRRAEDLLHPLENYRVVVADEAAHSLHPVQVVAILFRKFDHQRHQPGVVERVFFFDANRGNVAMVMVVVFVGVLVMVVVPVLTVVSGPVAGASRSVCNADPFAEGTVPDLRFEKVEIEQLVEPDFRMRRDLFHGKRVEPVHRVEGRAKFRLTDEIALVEDQLVGDRHLFSGFVVGFQLAADMLQIDQRDDRVQPVGQVQLHIGVQQLGKRRWIGDARGLDQDPIELDAGFECADPAHECPVEGFDKVVLAGAADAAVGQLQHVIRRAGDEIRIDADVAEFVDDDQAFAAAGIG